VVLNVELGAIFEGQRPSGLKPGFLKALPSRINGVCTVPEKPTALLGFTPRFGQRYRRKGAKAHVAGLAVEHVPKNPRPATAFDLQIETTPIQVKAGTLAPQSYRRKPIYPPRHGFCTHNPTHNRCLDCGEYR
jgi:hypothetical protein